MDGLDYWRLCDELSIVQAALLIVGLDPGESAAYVENWDFNKRPTGYEAAKAALASGLRSGAISGRVVPEFEWDMHGNRGRPIQDSLEVKESTVEVESLRSWLSKRGFKRGFFFPEASGQPDYLDQSHPRYAPKLAAAVRAWEAVTDPGKKSPKQALEKWLRENAAEFEMTDDEGAPMNTPIEECSKVANWQPGGGSPASNSRNLPTP